MSERNYGHEAQRAAELHLMACYEARDAEEAAELGAGWEGEVPPSPASMEFCGCQDCEIREILYAAWPILRQAALDGCE